MSATAKAGNFDSDLLTEMKTVRDRYNISFGKQVLDFLKLRGTGLTFEEYILYGLYARSEGESAAYMGDARARSAFLVANKMTSWDAAEDKLYFSTLVSDAYAPTPRILGVYHKTRRTGSAAALTCRRDLVEFLQTCPLPIFGKPIVATHGDGAINIVDRSGARITDVCGESRTIVEVADEIIEIAGDVGYIFQEALTPSNQISAITNGRLATARLLVLVKKDGPAVCHGVLRLPAGDNHVDSFRRPGNLIAPIDISCGRLGKAKCGIGPAQSAMSAHPDTGASIEGVVLDNYKAAREITLKASGIYPDLHLQSWDVAFTDKGPMLIEMNPGGNFNLLQIAGERGAFNPEFRAFLTDCLSDVRNNSANPKALKEARKLLKLG